MYADLEKAEKKKGPGSRGGHIIGHTRSGKPVYGPSAKHTAAVGEFDRLMTAEGKRKGEASQQHVDKIDAAYRAHEESTLAHHKNAKFYSGWSSADHNDAHQILESEAKKHPDYSPERFAHRSLANRHVALADVRREKEAYVPQNELDEHVNKYLHSQVPAKKSLPPYWAHPMYEVNDMQKSEDAEKALMTQFHTPVAHGRQTVTARPKAAPSTGSTGPLHSSTQTFAPGEHHEPVTMGQHAAAKMRSAAGAVRSAAGKMAAGVRPMKPALARSIECPHCHSGISKGYAVQALAMLAKSEGHDFDEDLEQFLTEEQVNQDSPEMDKSSKVGNKVASHRGSAPGKILQSTRGHGTGQAVQRHNTPTNPTTEKSLRLPVINGDPQLVEYSWGEDAVLSKAIENDNLHVPPARNLRAEYEDATGELTPE